MFGKILRLIVSVVGIASVCLISGLTLAQQNGPQAGAALTTLTTFETIDFSGSGICAFCHSSLKDEAGNDVSMDAHWRSTMMANAAKDPLWQAKISSEIDRAPNLAQAIQEKCSRCHMGMARYQQQADGDTPDDIYVLDSGFLDPNHYLHEAAMDGVSCTLCHQVTAQNLGTDLSFTGKYIIETDTFSPDRKLFGPYELPPPNPMQQNTGFVPTYHNFDEGWQLADSAHCGSCHTLYTPTLNADGYIIGEFPEQTTYLEWANSTVTATCQDCHLPKAAGPVVISNRPRRLAPRNSFGQHHYVGGNSFMVNLLMNNAAVLGVTADADTHLKDTLDRTLAQLKENTASLTASASLTITGNQLAVEVRVENLAGHKFPSGLPSRRAWLHVTVADAGGKIVFESGKPLADGSIAFNDADANPKDFEPHYDEINFSHEVQIYEPVMLNTDGAVTYTLLRANEYVKDNRLLPTGFIIDNASFPDIGVYGEAEFDDNFTGGSDQILYDVNVSSAKGQDLTVTVELLFQSLSFPFVEDLNVTTTPLPLVQKFMGIYDPAENKPVVVAKILPITVVR